MIIEAHHLNLRHLSAFTEVCRRGSISQAADIVHLSQPAVTHAVARLENQLRTRLLSRGPRGVTPTGAGAGFALRAERALARLARPARAARHETGAGGPRATSAQLRALMAIGEAGSYAAAARALGAAQPTVYRAARDLEQATGLTLFDTPGRSVRLTRQGEMLERAAQLMFAELEQGVQEIEAMLGRGQGRVRVGALPLARATILSHAIDRVLDDGLALRVYVDDGPFPDLLHAVHTGALDILVGALREPPPSPDIRQEVLFQDRLAVFCGPGHPLLKAGRITHAALSQYPWVLPRAGTPTRSHFEAAFPDLSEQVGATLVETSSMVLVRQLLQTRERLTLISRAQVATETRQGLLIELPVPMDDPPRPIGLLRRADWYPTEAQEAFLDALRAVSA